MARLAITSFVFMLVWVPEPVCQILSGKWLSSSPAINSSQAATINSPTSGSNSPRAMLVLAADCFKIPNPRIRARGITSTPMSKFISERAVWAPKYRSAGTSNSPIESRSSRTSSAAADATLGSTSTSKSGALASAFIPSSTSLTIVADLPCSRPRPTCRSSRFANFSGILMLRMRRSPALCLAMLVPGS